ncbi:glycogen/starch/alpha-glucan phosphorylase [Thermodesulfobacteriota bacterium]
MSKKKKGDYFCGINKPHDLEVLKEQIYHHLLIFQGRDPELVGNLDLYKALAYTLRDLLIENWIKTQRINYTKKKKRVYYLSLEFLIGRSLGNALINLGLYEEVESALKSMGYDLDEIREMEEDAALGNGGLGRLAACFMDSMATLGLPAYGYGIRYEFGIFFQKLLKGYQVESPDDWLRGGTPWEFQRPHHMFPVHFYGQVKHFEDKAGNRKSEWIDTEEVMAMACDYLVPGYRNNHVNNMRLWTAKASRNLDLSFFNRGDYIAAVQSKVKSETLSKVLYPSDDIRQGQELRLRQQYFFVAATLQDILRRYNKKHKSFDQFSDSVAIQLNDTHPAIAIPELMRLLVDIEGVKWDKAWQICVDTFGFTNHTLMPEALETWPVETIGRVLPRHLEIIYEINHQFLQKVDKRFPGNVAIKKKLSLIEEGPVKKVRMAALAIIGSHSVNGVAELHSNLLRTRIFKDFYKMFPERFNNKTNGITQRRWLLKSNPDLASLITETIGDAWVTNLDHLRELEPLAEDEKFQKKWARAKKNRKVKLAKFISLECGVAVDPESMFDVHVKRIHEYKRQLLNILHVIHFYHWIVSNPSKKVVPRTVIFGGKAAPSYFKAKLIIRLICSVGDVVNNDSRTNGKLRVVFIQNYGVSLAERIIPAADLSEQISTAGTEASGTGNMKFALNGALTIGTLDGANIEIREEVGAENIFIFGMTAEEVEKERKKSSRSPKDIYASNDEVRRTIESISNGFFNKGNKDEFRSLVDGLLDPYDPYLLIRDFEDYVRCQKEVSRAYTDQKGWWRKSILNVARIGKFSTDRTIREYAEGIWGIKV